MPMTLEEPVQPAPSAWPARRMLTDLVKLCRPKDWAKNLFVLVPIFFTQALFRPASLLSIGLAFACFCLWSSAVYLLNDTLDAPSDRRHPRKCQRPIAAGRIGPGLALGVSLTLTATVAFVAYLFLPL